MIVATASNGSTDVKEGTFYSLLSKYASTAKYIVETGTYHGTGTTRALVEGMPLSASLVTIEVNPHNHAIACNNINSYRGNKTVQAWHGLSLSLSELPTLDDLQKLLHELKNKDIYVDHPAEYRVQRYLDEVTPAQVLRTGLLEEACTVTIPDLFVLDSAGHMGMQEFNKVLAILDKNPSHSCVIALDDTNHVKHYKSVEKVLSMPYRFKVLEQGAEKFGYCIVQVLPLC